MYVMSVFSSLFSHIKIRNENNMKLRTEVTLNKLDSRNGKPIPHRHQQEYWIIKFKLHTGKKNKIKEVHISE